MQNELIKRAESGGPKELCLRWGCRFPQGKGAILRGLSVPMQMQLNDAKMVEPIEMPFGRLALVGPRKHVLDGDQGRTNGTNPFAAARGYKRTMRPFVNIISQHVLTTTIMVRCVLLHHVVRSLLFGPGFLTGALQVHARKYGLPIDHLTFEYHVLDVYRDQAEVTAATARLTYGQELEQDRAIGPAPADGILVHGLFMDGFRWDDQRRVIADSLPGVMNSPLPVMHMEPKMDFEAGPEDYRAPLYKTASRAGVLSTTGQLVFLITQILAVVVVVVVVVGSR